MFLCLAGLFDARLFVSVTACFADSKKYLIEATVATHDNLKGNIGRKKIMLNNDFKQAGQGYGSLSKLDQNHLIDNIVDSLGKADKPIQ